MQQRRAESGGLLRSAYGKARGMALRLSLVLAMLRWCAEPGEAPPRTIGEDTFNAACLLVADYAMPMAARVFGDAAVPRRERDAATLARWIIATGAAEVPLRHLQRDVRLPGLDAAERLARGAGRRLSGTSPRRMGAGCRIAP